MLSGAKEVFGIIPRVSICEVHREGKAMFSRLERIEDAAIKIHAVDIDIQKLPSWRQILQDLPIGCGIKGGIGRKVLKIISGLKPSSEDTLASEFGDGGDVDIFVATQELNQERRMMLRVHFAGMYLGNMKLEAKDIEFGNNLTSYFQTRDISMNEVLLFRKAESAFTLLYSEQAREDAVQGIIRPSMHVLHQGFHQVWELDKDFNKVPTFKTLNRCIMRFIKGHGNQYAVSKNAWEHHRSIGLGYREIYWALKPFHANDNLFSMVSSHLKCLGLLEEDLNTNILWGECLEWLNGELAKFGKRLKLSEPNATEIEDWIEYKKSRFQEWLWNRQSKIAIGEVVEDDVKSEVSLPRGWNEIPAWYGEDDGKLEYCVALSLG